MDPVPDVPQGLGTSWLLELHGSQDLRGDTLEVVPLRGDELMPLGLLDRPDGPHVVGDAVGGVGLDERDVPATSVADTRMLARCFGRQ